MEYLNVKYCFLPIIVEQLYEDCLMKSKRPKCQRISSKCSLSTSVRTFPLLLSMNGTVGSVAEWLAAALLIAGSIGSCSVSGYLPMWVQMFVNHDADTYWEAPF